MFRKLVSSLPFSPALVGQIGFYARRLRREELTRRLGLGFTILAVAVQSLAVFNPPEQALAGSESDIVKGGITSVQDVLNVYDNPKADYKSLMDYIGISRAELAAMSKTVTYVCSSDHSIISFGRGHHYSAAEGELVHKVPSPGGVSTFYSVPLYRFDSVNHTVNCYDSYVGQSKKIGWFSIMRKCGNLQIKSNVQRFPIGHLVKATCSAITGYAYDERQLSQSVNVYIYFDGPPGQGKKFGPYSANQTTPTSPVGGAHGFSVAVPKEYQTGKSIAVWAVMQPLAGWDQPMVQFDNKLTLPGNCLETQPPVAECLALTFSNIDRTHIKLASTARADSGASVTGYSFTIADKNGKQIYSKDVTTADLSVIVQPNELTTGQYTAKVVVHTTIGDKNGVNCTTPVTIALVGECIFNGTISSQDARCKPCPYDATIWIENKNCVPFITQSKSAKNLTQNIADANQTTANTTDRIEYTIRTTNNSAAPAATQIDESLGTVLGYSQIIDNGGGTYNDTTKTLSFGSKTLAPNQTQTYSFVVQVFDSIPATARGANDPSANTCSMVNSYGNTISIKLPCPPIKTIEATVKSLPSTGPGENILFATVTLMVVTYFFARSKLLHKELAVVRKEFTTGGL